MNKTTGRCALLFPHGVLFRDEEKSMREKLVEMDILDCVIGLGANLFFNASMEACIVICNNDKPASHKNKVLFIDAKDDVTRKNAESYLEPIHIEKIVETYGKYEDISGFAKVASIDEIVGNNSELRIALYVHPEEQSEVLDFYSCLSEWNGNIPALHAEIESLIKILE
jgi:type I restriction enzyme M protein